MDFILNAALSAGQTHVCTVQSANPQRKRVAKRTGLPLAQEVSMNRSVPPVLAYNLYVQLWGRGLQHAQLLERYPTANNIPGQRLAG
jgi:hypothetical protein